MNSNTVAPCVLSLASCMVKQHWLVWQCWMSFIFSEHSQIHVHSGLNATSKWPLTVRHPSATFGLLLISCKRVCNFEFVVSHTDKITFLKRNNLKTCTEFVRVYVPYTVVQDGFLWQLSKYSSSSIHCLYLRSNVGWEKEKNTERKIHSGNEMKFW